MIATLLLSSVALLSTPFQASDGDWPGFRGPDGCARAVGAALPDLERPRFRVELPGDGRSSPVIVGERVFLLCTAPGRDVRILVALSTRDGATLWRRELPFTRYPEHALNDPSATTPVVADGRVHLTVVDGSERLALSFDLDGEPLWKTVLGPWQSDHGDGPSPVLADGVLVCCGDNEGPASWLVGLDAATGEERWRRERKSLRASFATPLVVRAEGAPTEVVFASSAHGLTSLFARSGELAWEVTDLFERRCVASPILADGLVLASAGQGGGGQESVALDPWHGEAGGPRIAHRPRRNLPYVPTPVAVGELVFMVSDGGLATCLVAATGDELWRERLGGEYFGSPVLVGERLYVLSKEGELVVFGAGEEFRIHARVDLGEPTNATPAFAHGTLYLRTERHLSAYD